MVHFYERCGALARIYQKIAENTGSRLALGKTTFIENEEPMMNQKYVGSNFDEFLEEEGLLAVAEAVAVKRVVAFQISQLMEEYNLTKTVMAKRMKTSRAALERLLDPENGSVTLQTLERAALALGKRLQIGLANYSERKHKSKASVKRSLSRTRAMHA